MVRTVGKASSAAESRADKMKAVDNKKVSAVALKAPNSSAIAAAAAKARARPTQAGKRPLTAQQRSRLDGAHADKPLDRRGAKPAAKEKEPRARRKKNRMLKEITEQQKSTEFALPRAPFRRLVREVLNEVTEKTDTPFRVTLGAFEALQTSGEEVLTQVFSEANRLVYLLRQKMLMNRPFRFTLRTLNRVGAADWLSKGSIKPELFEMGRGVTMQQLFGKQQIDEYKKARAILNAEKRGPKKPRRMPKGIDADEEEDQAEEAEQEEEAEAEDEDAFPEPPAADVDEE